MNGYFNDCNSVTELSLRRSEIIAAVNKEYNDKRNALLASTAEMRQIRMLQLDAIDTPETPLYTAFPVIVGEVPFNEIHLGDPMKI